MTNVKLCAQLHLRSTFTQDDCNDIPTRLNGHEYGFGYAVIAIAG